jgi:translocation and assembly module TamB
MMAHKDSALTPKNPWRWLKIISIILLVIIVSIALAITWLTSQNGQAWVLTKINARTTQSGFGVKIGKLEGSLFSDATVSDVHLRDLKGDFLIIHKAHLIWHARSILNNSIDIDRADIKAATWLRKPELKTVDPNAPLLPKQDIRIGNLTLQSLTLAPGIIGKEYNLRGVGSALIKKGIVNATLDTKIANTNDRAHLTLISEPDKNKFDIDLEAQAEPQGPLAQLAHINQGFSLQLKGGGDYQNWDGIFLGTIKNAPFLNVKLAQKSGSLSAIGTWAAPDTLPKLYQNIARTMPNIESVLSFNDKNLKGRGKFFGDGVNLAWQVAANLDDNKISLAHATLSDPQGRIVPLVSQKISFTGMAADVTAEGNIRQPTVYAKISGEKINWANYSLAKPLITLKNDITQTGKFLISLQANDAQTGIVALNDKLKKITLSTHLLLSNKIITASDYIITGNDLTARGTATYELTSASWRSTIADLKTNILTPSYGTLPVVTRGTIARDDQNSDITLNLNGSINVNTWRGPAEMKRLLGITPLYSAVLTIAPSGATRMNNITLSGNGSSFKGKGSIINKNITANIDGTINNLGKIIPTGPLATIGAVPITLALSGSIDSPRIQAEFSTRMFTASGIKLENVKLALQPLAQQQWLAKLTARAPLGDATIESKIQLFNGSTELQAINGTIGDLAITGDLAINKTGIALGKIDVTRANAPTQFLASSDFTNLNNTQLVTSTLKATDFRSLWNGRPLRIGTASGTVKVALAANAPATLNFTGANISVSDWALTKIETKLSGPLKSLQGKYSLAGTRGTAFDVTGDISSRALNTETTQLSVGATGSVGGQSVRFEAPAEITLGNSSIQLAPVKLLFAGGSALVSGTKNNNDIAMTLELTNANLALLQIIDPKLGFTGTASGLAKISMRDGKLNFADGNISFKKFRRTGVFLSSAPLNGAAVLTLNKNALTATFKAAINTRAVGKAELTLIPSSSGNLQRGNLQGTAEWDGPAEALWGLIGTDANDIRGPLKLSATFAGTAETPTARGQVEMRGGRYENIALGMIINGINVNGEFVGANLAITSAHGDLSAGGSIDGTGTVDLSLERGLPTKLNLELKRAAIVKRDDIEAIVSGPVAITYGFTGGRVSGKLNVDRARIRAGSPSAETIADISVREINKPTTPSISKVAFTTAKPWSLDLAVTAPEKIFISGLGLNSEWSGAFNVTGISAAPRLLGKMQILRGEYEFAGRRFSVSRGDISFQGTSPINPVLGIEASARAGDTTAVIRIAGTAFRPNITFTAQPALPQDEILSRLLFGTSVQSLSALEAVQLAAALNQLSSAKGGLNVLGKVKRAAGIDRLRILPADAASGRNTTLSGGKYLTDRIYLEVATDGRGYTATTIEVDVTRTLSILSQIATLGGTNVGVKWSKDY